MVSRHGRESSGIADLFLSFVTAFIVFACCTTVVRAEEPLALSIMTFNVRTSNIDDGENAWDHRKALVVDTILSQAPQVLGFQEALADQLKYLSEALPEYRWLGVDRGLNGGTGLSEYTPIFYRYTELVPIESGTFWLSSTPEGPRGSGWRRNVSRIVTWAQFHHVTTGLRFYVFNTHLTLRRGPRQLESVRMIKDRLATLPSDSAIVVTGDFNAIAETSDTWEAATSDGLRDAWVVATERYGPSRTSGEFGPPEEAPDGRIDWILVGGPIGVRSVETVVTDDRGRYASDHYPVVAEIEVREE